MIGYLWYLRTSPPQYINHFLFTSASSVAWQDDDDDDKVLERFLLFHNCA